MKRFHLCMALLVLISFPALAGSVYLISGDPAPVLKGKKVAGGHLTLEWGDSRLTLVNFWATWCEPCRKEMPFLQELSQRYPKEDLRIIGVNVDENQEAPVAGFLLENGVHYTVIQGGSRSARLWGGIGVLPTSFLVDSQGRIVARFKGGTEETMEKMSGRIESLLK